jgi:predicted RNase H-like HicB family nuclease
MKAAFAGIIHYMAERRTIAAGRREWLHRDLRATARRRLNVFVPALPEICTHGETMEEARAVARDAIQCYLESALETGEHIPEDVKELLTERVEVTIL